VSVLVVLAFVAGCADDEEGEPPRAARSAIAAPPQQSARIAAVRTRFGNPPRFALLELDESGSEQRLVVRAPADELERLSSPAWSPDAKRVYFVGTLGEREGERFRYHESDVFVVDVHGGKPRRVTRWRDVVAVAPSPDGRTLLVGRFEDPAKGPPFAVGLWLAGADGTNERRLLDAPDGAFDLDGTWSPDGRRIAFTRCGQPRFGEAGLVETTCAVHGVAADGSDLHKLADRSTQPAFSPDGRRLAFVSDRDQHGMYATGADEVELANELYVMDADGGDQRRLTRSEGLSEATPAWSPDNSRIAFERVGPARFTSQVMAVNADGTCPTVVIGNAAVPAEQPTSEVMVTTSFESPVWRPGHLTGKLAPLACG
jgi:Tol biopolymer transport system component